VYPQVLPALLPRLTDRLRIGDVTNLDAHAFLDELREKVRRVGPADELLGELDERAKPALEHRRDCWRGYFGDSGESRLGATAVRVTDDEDCGWGQSPKIR
jgi:hypothetical protein